MSVMSNKNAPMILELGVDWKKIILFVLDAILEIGLGIAFLPISQNDSSLLWAGVFLILFGSVQLIRKIKTFHLSKTHLLIKRPLMPFKFAQVDFELEKVDSIELKRVARLGPHIRILGKKDGGFMLRLDKKSIDSLERELRLLGVSVIRENL